MPLGTLRSKHFKINFAVNEGIRDYFHVGKAHARPESLTVSSKQGNFGKGRLVIPDTYFAANPPMPAP
jgi:hypothetical protein